MPKASKTGVRGLYFDENEGCFRIDIRWQNPRTGKKARHRERLPPGIDVEAAELRAKELLQLSLAGNLRVARGRPTADRKAVANSFLVAEQTGCEFLDSGGLNKEATVEFAKQAITRGWILSATRPL